MYWKICNISYWQSPAWFSGAYKTPKGFKHWKVENDDGGLNSGHSFLNRFLFTCVPWSVFSKDSATILSAVLKEMALNLKNLYLEGVEVCSTRYYFALIGVKGDAEFHVEAGEFCRSYLTCGTANSLAMCPECDADDNFGDVSDDPAWLPTVTEDWNMFLIGFGAKGLWAMFPYCIHFLLRLEHLCPGIRKAHHPLPLCHLAINIKLFCTSGICSTLSSMEWGESRVLRYCWC